MMQKYFLNEPDRFASAKRHQWQSGPRNLGRPPCFTPEFGFTEDHMSPLFNTIPDPDFPQLTLQLRARLHRYCARMTGSMIDGEDIVQETLIKANEGYDASTVRNLEGWVFRIAHNTAVDFMRRRKLEWGIFTDEDVETLVDPQAEADRRHATTAALRTFMRLPPTQRSTVILADVLGYTLDEAADVMGITVPAAKAALHRGRIWLRELSQQPDDAVPLAKLSVSDQALLTAYAERFNARDFEGLREMLGQNVRLDLVARRKPMSLGSGEYFTTYAKINGLRMTPMNFEGMPGLWVSTEANEGPGASGYAVVLESRDGQVLAIRDFYFARYAMDAVANGITPAHLKTAG